jgi:hypothetical protein
MKIDHKPCGFALWFRMKCLGIGVAVFNRNQFYHLVRKHHSERYAKGYNSGCWAKGCLWPVTTIVGKQSKDDPMTVGLGE